MKLAFMSLFIHLQQLRLFKVVGFFDVAQALSLGRNGGTEGEGVPAPAVALAGGLSQRDPSLARGSRQKTLGSLLSCPLGRAAYPWRFTPLPVFGASSCTRSCAVPGRDGLQLCASLPSAGVADGGVVQGSARALIPFGMMVVLVGDALRWVQPSPGAGSHIPQGAARTSPGPCSACTLFRSRLSVGCRKSCACAPRSGAALLSPPVSTMAVTATSLPPPSFHYT